MQEYKRCLAMNIAFSRAELVWNEEGAYSVTVIVTSRLEKLQPLQCDLDGMNSSVIAILNDILMFYTTVSSDPLIWFIWLNGFQKCSYFLLPHWDNSLCDLFQKDQTNHLP